MLFAIPKIPTLKVDMSEILGKVIPIVYLIKKNKFRIWLLS